MLMPSRIRYIELGFLGPAPTLTVVKEIDSWKILISYLNLQSYSFILFMSLCFNIMREKNRNEFL